MVSGDVSSDERPENEEIDGAADDIADSIDSVMLEGGGKGRFERVQGGWEVAIHNSIHILMIE